MKKIRKIFKLLVHFILIPAILIICVIVWSHITGNHLKLPKEYVQTENFLLTTPVHTENVYLVSSPENIDEETKKGALLRGYIRISKSDLNIMTSSQYLEFYNTVLKDSNYIWFSIICPDNTGLFIPNCQDGSACFCTLDSLGRQTTDIYGYMIVKNHQCYYEEVEK